MSSILKVDEIQNTGGTTGLTIDSSGRVLKPNIPYGQFSGPNSNTTSGNVINIAANIITGGGMTADTSNNRMIVPIAGLYVVGFNQLISDNANYVSMRIRKNGSDVLGSRIQSAQNHNYGAISGHRIIELSANDYIEWYVISGTIYGGSTDYNNNYIYLLG